jgi:hypothetical protein
MNFSNTLCANFKDVRIVDRHSSELTDSTNVLVLGITIEQIEQRKGQACVLVAFHRRLQNRSQLPEMATF